MLPLTRPTVPFQPLPAVDWSPTESPESPESPRQPSPRATNKAAIRVTSADHRLLLLLCRYGYATATQVHRATHPRPQAPEQATYARLRRLQDAGLVRRIHDRVPRDTRSLYLATPTAYRWVNCALPPLRQVSLATLRHTLAVGDVGMTLERTGHDLLTDREIRSEIAATRRTSGSAPSRWQGDGRTHTPDLFLPQVNHVDGHVRSLAFEVELTAKPQGTLQRILEWYRDSPLVDDVVYTVGSPAVERCVRRAAAQANASHLMTITPYVPTAHSGGAHSRGC